MSAADRLRRWLRALRRSRIEYQLFVLAHQGDKAAERAWYEMVRARSAIEETPETGGEQ